MPLHDEDSNISDHLNGINRRRSPDPHGTKIISYGVSARIIADTFVPFKAKYQTVLSEKGRWTCAARDWLNRVDKISTYVNLLHREKEFVEEMKACTAPGYPPAPGEIPNSCRHAPVCLFCYARRAAEYYESITSVVVSSDTPLKLAAVRCPADSESVKHTVTRRRFVAAVSTTLSVAGRGKGVVIGVSAIKNGRSPTAEQIADVFVQVMKFPAAWCHHEEIRWAVNRCITDPTKKFVKYGAARGA